VPKCKPHYGFFAHLFEFDEVNGAYMITNRTQDEAANQLESITEQIQEGIREGKFSWSEIQGVIADKTREAARVTDEYVHENPWKMIGIAAGIGVIAGLLPAPSGKCEDDE
jgi:ElaB/YqjD/DUF883 family membrane-anchored ribosome-binding protein